MTTGNKRIGTATLALLLLLAVPTEAFLPTAFHSQSHIVLHLSASVKNQPQARSDNKRVPKASTTLLPKKQQTSIAYFDSVGDEIVPIVKHQTDNSAQQTTTSNNNKNLIESVLDTYWGPRIILGCIPIIYATNFALGSLMADSYPPPIVTATRMSLAAALLCPWMRQISSTLLSRSILTGLCTATGYVSQSLALGMGTDSSRVSFLGCATVLWCPVLEYFVDGRDVSWKGAPQLWLAALFCLLGVGILELDLTNSLSSSTGSMISVGDGLSILQAVGFGTGCFLSAKLVREEPTQVLPVTSVLIGVTAVLSWIWCACTVSDVSSLPNILDPSMQGVLGAILWTGIISTSLNFVVEISALSRVPASEASVLLATEPIWAALFANVWIGETLGLSDYVGGGFIIGACLINAVLKPDDLQRIFGGANATK